MDRKLPVELPVGYLDFYKKLESWQNEKQAYLSRNISFKKHDIISTLAQNQKPLLKVKNPNIAVQDFKQIFLSLVEFLKDARPEQASLINICAEKVELFDFDLILKKLLEEDAKYFAELASKLEVSEELLIFILDHALRPFLRLYASVYQEELLNDEFQTWNFASICPVCGAKSHLSRLRGSDGRRFMFCDRCFSEWESRYLQCIHCGNDEPRTIKYLSVDDDSFYHIYVCEKCKGYAKAFDERSAGKPTDLFIANIETIYLDMLAQDRGYTDHDS